MLQIEVEEQALRTSQLCILYYTVSKSEQIPNEPCKTKTSTLCHSYRISFQCSVSEGLPEAERMELITENQNIPPPMDLSLLEPRLPQMQF